MTYLKNVRNLIFYVLIRIIIFLLSLHIIGSFFFLRSDIQNTKNYYRATCVVLKKRMVYEALGMNEKTKQVEEEYSAKYDVEYVINNVKYDAVAMNSLYSNEGNKDEINQEMKAYNINATYPCWYNVNDSSNVIFNKNNIWPVMLIEIVILLLLILFASSKITVTYFQSENKR